MAKKKSPLLSWSKRLLIVVLMWIIALIACLNLEHIKGMFESAKSFTDTLKLIQTYVYGLEASWLGKLAAACTGKELQIDWDSTPGKTLYFTLWAAYLALSGWVICERRKLILPAILILLAILLATTTQGCRTIWQA